MCKVWVEKWRHSGSDKQQASERLKAVILNRGHFHPLPTHWGHLAMSGVISAITAQREEVLLASGG